MCSFISKLSQSWNITGSKCFNKLIYSNWGICRLYFMGCDVSREYFSVNFPLPTLNKLKGAPSYMHYAWVSWCKDFWIWFIEFYPHSPQKTKWMHRICFRYWDGWTNAKCIDHTTIKDFGYDVGGLELYFNTSQKYVSDNTCIFKSRNHPSCFLPHM